MHENCEVHGLQIKGIETKVKEHDTQLNGNGRKGLKDRMTALETISTNFKESLDNMDRTLKWFIGLSVGVFGANIGNIIINLSKG